jgi:hypothetical protein
MSRFIIIRKDLTETDPTVIESDGLTIGRNINNEVTLNHPSVSRTHAGIKEINGELWITNLSNANGTIVNGSAVASAPLVAGDVIQIGPFTLYATFPKNSLALTVEMSVNPFRAEGAGTSMLAPVDESGKTTMLNPQAMRDQSAKPAAKGTQRLSLTGKLTGLLGKNDEAALKVFWDKRKRDAGKMAEVTALRPNLVKGKLGKARFNWRSTSDLRRPWSGALFVWAAVAVALLSVVAAYAYKNAYSPGELSSAHLRPELTEPDPKLAVATAANDNSCTTCHSMTASIESRCVECHTTPGFKSTVSDDHSKLGMTCFECHGEEHHGDSFSLTASKASCVECHRDGYVYTNRTTGETISLTTPHGGEDIGYPVTNGKWAWAGWSPEKWSKRELPKGPTDFDSKQQFHLIHVMNGDPLERVQCSDCHTAGFDAAKLMVGVRESCVGCHSPAAADAGPEAATAGLVECTSCHQQHTEGGTALARAQTQRRNTGRQN